ncbi:MAG: protein-export chaperone SecB [Thermodesulfobacteriota bacterium]|nr:protein-export chaperone SecB [Thermodesulfobacteriota bacterium]
MDKHNFTLEEIRIIEVDFKLNQPTENGEIEVDPVLSFSHKVDGEFLEVTLGIAFEHPSAPFRFSLVGFGKFKFQKDIDENFADKIDQVAIVNCCSMIFPFIRESVAELTRKAGFTPMLLPPVNFVNVFKSMEGNSRKGDLG